MVNIQEEKIKYFNKNLIIYLSKEVIEEKKGNEVNDNLIKKIIFIMLLYY